MICLCRNVVIYKGNVISVKQAEVCGSCQVKYASPESFLTVQLHTSPLHQYMLNYVLILSFLPQVLVQVLWACVVENVQGEILQAFTDPPSHTNVFAFGIGLDCTSCMLVDSLGPLRHNLWSWWDRLCLKQYTTLWGRWTKRYTVDKDFGTQKVFFCKTATYSWVLEKSRCKVFPEGPIEGAEYYIAESNGVWIDGEDIILDNPSGGERKLPWTLAV